MLVHKRSDLSLLDGCDLTDRHAADVVCLRKPSRKATRQTKKLESERDVESARVMRDAGLPPSLESTNLKSEDRAADVARLRKSSRKSTRRSPKLESLIQDKPDDALLGHAVMSPSRLPRHTVSREKEDAGDVWDEEDKRRGSRTCMATLVPGSAPSTPSVSTVITGGIFLNAMHMFVASFS